MAIEDPNRNPFLGIYKKPQGGQANNAGMGQPQDFLSSEEVIGRPDAQNTAQRSKSVASGMKDAYDAVQKAKDLVPRTPQQELSDFDKQKQDAFKKYGNIRKNPFSGEKGMAFDAAMGKRELTEKLQGIVNTNFAEFQAVSEILDRKENPQKYTKMGAMDPGLGGIELMKWGGGGVGKGQHASTSKISHEYDLFKPMKPGGAAPWVGFSSKESTTPRLDAMQARQGQPIATPTPRLDAMKAMNETSKPNALVPGTDFSGRTIQEKPKYGNGVYAPEYMDIYNSF